jgi:hypothetical protein
VSEQIGKYWDGIVEERRKENTRTFLVGHEQFRRGYVLIEAREKDKVGKTAYIVVPSDAQDGGDESPGYLLGKADFNFPIYANEGNLHERINDAGRVKRREEAFALQFPGPALENDYSGVREEMITNWFFIEPGRKADFLAENPAIAGRIFKLLFADNPVVDR